MVSVFKITQIQQMPHLCNDQVAETIQLKLVTNFLGYGVIEFNITCQLNIYAFIKIGLQIDVLLHSFKKSFEQFKK